MTLSHWLMVNVVMKAENAAVWAATSGLVALFIVAPIRGAIKRLRSQVASILDSLDPDVPVGLTKQIDDVKADLERLNHHVATHTISVHVEPEKK